MVGFDLFPKQIMLILCCSRNTHCSCGVACPIFKQDESVHIALSRIPVLLVVSVVWCLYIC